MSYRTEIVCDGCGINSANGAQWLHMQRIEQDIPAGQVDYCSDCSAAIKRALKLRRENHGKPEPHDRP